MRRSGWAIGIVIALVLILLVGGGLVASGGWGGLPFMGPIFGLVFVCLIIGGAVWFVQSRSREESRLGSGPTATETPLEILKRRYASGEVTKEQLEDMRRTLNS